MIKNVIVDLSHWNQSVDFKLAKEDRILGVIHKATQGIRYIDPTYAERKKTAEEEGLMWGAYHFGIGENGRDQADHFLETIGDSSDVLLALDIEENRDGKNITPKQAEDFVDKVHEVTATDLWKSLFSKRFRNADFNEMSIMDSKVGSKANITKRMEKMGYMAIH